MICVARCKTNILEQCKFKKMNNCEFCKKHQNYTGKTINEPLYSIDEIKLFIYNCTYITNVNIFNKTVKKNIILSKYILQIYNYKYNNKLNIKNTLKHFNEFIHYFQNIKSIIKIQSYTRKKYISTINKLKGPGLLHKSINDTDFYTFEEKNKINYNYFFSYNENSNQNSNQNIYFFDIRSFKLLIDNNPDNVINPYNRKIIPNYVINNYKILIKYLVKKNINIIFEDDILTEDQIFNQKIIEIFQKIDKFGYNTSIEWFTELSHYGLKNLWAHLEDIWNYRSNLSFNDKNNIIQKTLPQPFLKFKYINKNINKKLLQEYILNDINIFLISGKNQDFCNIGCLYVLTSLSIVSKKCIDAMPWLSQI